MKLDRRFVFALAAAGIAAASTGEVRADCPLVPGDINGDGTANVNDVVCITKASQGFSYDYLLVAPLPCMGESNPKYVDADCDFDVDEDDAAAVMELVLGESIGLMDSNENGCVDVCELGCDCDFNTACNEETFCEQLVPGCGMAKGLQAGAPWPMRGYCAGRGYQAPAAGPREPVVTAVFNAGPEAALEHVVINVDGTLIASDRRGLLHGFNNADGAPWTAPLDPGAPYADGPLLGGVSAPLVGDDGRILASYWDGMAGICSLCAVEPNGESKWCISGAGCASEIAPGGDNFMWSAHYFPAILVGSTQKGTPIREVGLTQSPRAIEPLVRKDGVVLTYPGGPAPQDSSHVLATSYEGAVEWETTRRVGYGTGVSMGADEELYGYADAFSLTGEKSPVVWRVGKTGLVSWETPMLARGIHAPATAPDGSLRVADELGFVSAYSAEGEYLWSAAPAGLPPAADNPNKCGTDLGQPTVDSAGTAFVALQFQCGGDTTSGVAAINAHGGLEWMLEMDVAVRDTHIAMTADHELVVVSADRTQIYLIGE